MTDTSRAVAKLVKTAKESGFNISIAYTGEALPIPEELEAVKLLEELNAKGQHFKNMYDRRFLKLLKVRLKQKGLRFDEYIKPLEGERSSIAARFGIWLNKLIY